MSQNPKVQGALALAQAGRVDSALGMLGPLTTADPEAAALFADLLRHVGRTDEAIALLQDLIHNDEQDSSAQASLGRCYMAVRNLPLAETHLSRAVSLQPGNGAYSYFLAECFLAQGKNSAAKQGYAAAIRLAPEIAPAYVKLAQLLLDEGKRDQAIQVCRTAVTRHPDLADAHLVWAEALVEQDLIPDAESHLEFAQTVDPHAAVRFGFRLQVLGRFAQAQEQFEQALRSNPRLARAHYGITVGARVTEEDRPRIERMKGLLRDPSIPPHERIVLHFALGKAFDDLKEYKSAMQHYEEANGTAARVLQLPFDGERLRSINSWRIQTFDRDTIQRCSQHGSASDRPIFIVGMIRSGTTLVEQVLSNHPEIAGGGELRFWTEAERELNDAASENKLTAEMMERLAAQYLALLENISSTKPYVIDKMPLNFTYLGMMHMLFPKAKIIHCKRLPIDNCLSIYTTYFDQPPPFAHVPENIMDYYAQYERLMEHWKRVLPASSLLEVRYEDMASEPAKTSRRVLEFCGLEWSDDVPHPERNTRSVRTPSYWQVRQPVYRSSLERWRNYEGYLHRFEKLVLGEP